MSWYAGHQQILHNIIEDNTLHLFLLSIFRGTYVLCLILKTTLKNNQKMFLFFKGEKKKKSSETSLDLPKFKLLVPSFFSLFIDFLNKYTEYSVCDESLRVN